jgi:alcohol dehydrogenase
MRLPSHLEFRCPVKIACGRRALEHLPYELHVLNAGKPLLLVDEDASREHRRRALVDALRESGMVLGAVEAIPATVDLDHVHQLAALYRDRDHDALVVMGAGPLADLAKLVNLVVSTGQDDPGVFVGDRGIEQRLKPLVLIAPASATGYEASGRVPTGPIALRATHLMPDLAIIDERTLGAADQAAIMDTGLAALAFGAEAMLAPEQNPMLEIYAGNAVQMAVGALETIGRVPDASVPRRHAAAAAVLAGCTLADKAPGRLHRLGRHLADTGRISFAGAMGILLPATVACAIRNKDWHPTALLAALVGIDRSASTPFRQQGMRATAALTVIVNALFELTAGGIPRTMRDAGFGPQDVAAVAEAFDDDSQASDHAAVRAVLACALDGDHFHSGDCDDPFRGDG